MVEASSPSGSMQAARKKVTKEPRMQNKQAGVVLSRWRVFVIPQDDREESNGNNRSYGDQPQRRCFYCQTKFVYHMEKTREELIDELKLELNPGSMSVENLIAKMVDKQLEDAAKIEALEKKADDLSKSVSELETSKRYWWNECDKKDEVIKKLKFSLKTLSDVSTNICDLWSL